MTSSTTQTERIPFGSSQVADELAKLTGRTQVVLWDFDGPVCRLFAGHPAEQIAVRMLERLDGLGLYDLLTASERAAQDPNATLRAIARRHPGTDLVTELEEWLTEEELTATATAWPTPYADILIRTWSAIGTRMAVTTNNAPSVVTSYLTGRGLADCFTSHVYGRSTDLHLLKPHPHILDRALRALNCAPENALMIGDTPTDLEAARRAGVPFLGYARNEEKAGQLWEEGAGLVVNSLEPVLEAVRGQGC